MQVTVYTKPGCHLCDDALQMLDRLGARYSLEVQEVNILEDMALYEALHEKIPVIEIEGGKMGRLEAPIDEQRLQTSLAMAAGVLQNRMAALQPEKEPWIDRAAAWISKHWVGMVCGALALFVGLAWLTPVFAALGWWFVANPLYTAYALTCHQLPERAGSVLGYQVAFCYRNTALYGGTLLFGMLYSVARDRGLPGLRWLKSPLPWWGFALLLLPMAVDGLSHMLGLRDDMFPGGSFDMFLVGSQAFSLNWWLRIVTGALAALGGVWFAFPRMDKTMEESEAMRLMYKEMALRQRALRQPAGEARV